MDVKEKLDENDKPYLLIKSEKRNTDYIIRKTRDGFVFYEIAVTSGAIPASLQGMYSSIDLAFRALKEYLRSAPESKAVQRDRKYAAKSKSKHKEPVQQGTAD